RIIGELEFGKVDVAIHEDGPHLKPSEVAADIGLAAQRIRIGPSLTPAAFDVRIDVASDADYDHQLRALRRLARMSTVSLLPTPAAIPGSSRSASARARSNMAASSRSSNASTTTACSASISTTCPTRRS